VELVVARHLLDDVAPSVILEHDEASSSGRPDVVLFVNGLPLAMVELKNAASENATIWTAFQQLQTYQTEVPSLFATNELLAVSDGVEARGAFSSIILLRAALSGAALSAAVSASALLIHSFGGRSVPGYSI
jgi:hypothetical protein